VIRKCTTEAGEAFDDKDVVLAGLSTTTTANWTPILFHLFAVFVYDADAEKDTIKLARAAEMLEKDEK
jgi:hypothetical protein